MSRLKGPEKRKATSDVSTSNSSSKRPKTEAPASATAHSQQDVAKRTVDEKPVKAPVKSLLAKEQPAFPRGGASLLTPLEKKQIDARAWRDAQKEAAGQPSLFDADAEPAGSDQEDAPVVKTKDNKSKKSKPGNKSTTPQLPKDTKIGGLSYKRLELGSLILGQIAAISDRDLTVSLPNSLTGYVPITSISQQLSSKIQRLVEVDPEEEDDAEDDIDLHVLFSVGQFVRTTVTSLGQSGAAGARKHIELSLEPVRVNTGLTKAALAPGVAVQAAVNSVEDHGVVVDMSLEGKETRGFIPAKNLPTGVALDEIKEGAVLLCQVMKGDGSSKVITLSADLTTSRSVRMPPTVEAFLPGTLAEILVTEVQDTGLVGKVMGMLTVTADLVHSGAFRGKESFADSYKVGSKLKGRLLYKIGPTDDCKAGFSVLEAAVRLAKKAPENDAEVKVGTIVDAATVITVEPGLGLYLDLGFNAVGFVHLSRLADGKVNSISATAGPYKVGSTHRARVTDSSPIDGLFGLSLQALVLEQRYLRLEDVSAGDKTTVKIEKAIIGPAGIKGLIVNISDNITGFIPDIHLSDAVVANPEKKFREGASIKARVLLVDLNKRQIRLTAKKTLVNTDANIWATYDEIKDGDSSVGTLVKVDAKGALVQFFGDVKGYLPVAEMSEAFIKDAREHFRVGQVLSLNVLNINVEDKRMTVSCREARPKPADPATTSSPTSGSLVNGTVFEKSGDDSTLR